MPSDSALSGTGLLLGALGIGGILGSSAASRRKRQLSELANTPGLSIGDIYGDTASSGQAALPGAETLINSENTFNADELSKLYEESLPGFKAAQASRLSAVAPLLRGEIPADVVRQIYRNSATRGASGGFSGSPAMGNLNAESLGLTSLDLLTKGNQLFSGIIGSTPMPKVASLQDFLLQPQQILALRSAERAQKLGLKAQAIGAPGASDVWGSGIQDVGGLLAGFGFNGGFSGSGGNNSAANDWIYGMTGG